MVGYRCYILDAEDHIVLAHDLNSTSDAEAEEDATRLLAQDPYYRSAEVWKATQRILRLQQDAVAQRLRSVRRAGYSGRRLGSVV